MLSRRAALALPLAAVALPLNAGPMKTRAAHFTFDSADGPIKLARHDGDVMLIVNTASKCGFADQLASLETVWQAYRSRGLLVLGVPSDDFGQELDTDAAIKEFCAFRFGVTFPLASVSVVTGQNAHPFYAWAASERMDAVPKWNFHKLLIGRDGQIAAVFPSAIDPLDRRVVDVIERELARPAGKHG